MGPIVIGATGGSGTRVVAEIVRAAGWDLGAPGNHAGDSFPLARFDWAHGLTFLRDRDERAVVDALDAAVAEHRETCAPGARWGWKHPQSYLLLELLASRFDDLHFVHVLRDGRDMVLASNQQQLTQYGEFALGEAGAPSPERSIRFWARANTRAANLGEWLLGDRYHRVRLEDLCDAPDATVASLVGFAGGSAAAERDATRFVQRPENLGRWRGLDGPTLAAVEAEGAAALERFGYARADLESRG